MFIHVDLSYSIQDVKIIYANLNIFNKVSSASVF